MLLSGTTVVFMAALAASFFLRPAWYALSPGGSFFLFTSDEQGQIGGRLSAPRFEVNHFLLQPFGHSALFEVERR